MEMDEAPKPNPESKLPDRQVTVRLENKAVEDFEEFEYGSGPPALPTPRGLKKIDPCWPCVLMGVGFVLVAVAMIWLEFVPKPE